MPTLLLEEEIKLEYSDMAKRSCAGMTGRIDMEDRPKGIHQSGILKRIALAMHILKPGEKLEVDYPMIWAMGVMWEEFAVSLDPGVVWQPGSVCFNDIWRSPDGLGLDEDGRVVQLEEYKFTYKKVRTGAELIEDFIWMHQGRGYLSALNRTYPGLRVCRWHVLYCRGDYKAFGPVYKRYTVEFSGKEIRDTEAMLLANVGDVEAEE